MSNTISYMSKIVNQIKGTFFTIIVPLSVLFFSFFYPLILINIFPHFLQWKRHSFLEKWKMYLFYFIFMNHFFPDYFPILFIFCKYVFKEYIASESALFVFIVCWFMGCFSLFISDSLSKKLIWPSENYEFMKWVITRGHRAVEYSN